MISVPFYDEMNENSVVKPMNKSNTNTYIELVISKPTTTSI